MNVQKSFLIFSKNCDLQKNKGVEKNAFFKNTDKNNLYRFSSIIGVNNCNRNFGYTLKRYLIELHKKIAIRKEFLWKNFLS